jgi:predicted amidohydrolase
MRVACAQVEVVGGDLDGNVDRAVEGIETAAADGADLVVLPELFTVGYFAIDSFARRAESLEGPTLARLADVASDHRVALLAGTVVEDLGATATETDVAVPEAEGFANTAVLFDSRGTRRAIYRARNLPGYSTGLGGLVTGESPGVATLDVGGESVTVGVTTGGDLRSPGPYGELAERGCDLVCVPAAWPYPRIEAWSVLPRARAIENGYYVAAANAAGEFEEATLLGRSAVYDPHGTPLASAGDDPALVRAAVDPARAGRAREPFPVGRDR